MFYISILYPSVNKSTGVGMGKVGFKSKLQSVQEMPNILILLRTFFCCQDEGKQGRQFGIGAEQWMTDVIEVLIWNP